MTNFKHNQKLIGKHKQSSYTYQSASLGASLVSFIPIFFPSSHVISMQISPIIWLHLHVFHCLCKRQGLYVYKYP